MATRRRTHSDNVAHADELTGARRAELMAHTQQVRDIILARQDPRTGLMPASTAITVHGDYTHAWVRDNVYSVLAVWAIALAWRRTEPTSAAPFEAAVVNLMRGLLAAMMKQSHKVERFKHTQDPLDALHAKYDTARGEPVVGDSEWGHLQLDATALYLLMVAQMSASGLRIVEHPDELAFVQNLVHYLAKAWRTPDYGIWERGHKRNEGVAELNASSLGMAKAALEAIDGFEPLPGLAPAVLVVGDDLAHEREPACWTSCRADTAAGASFETATRRCSKTTAGCTTNPVSCTNSRTSNPNGRSSLPICWSMPPCAAMSPR